jgi:hypothetical protein
VLSSVAVVNTSARKQVEFDDPVEATAVRHYTFRREGVGSFEMRLRRSTWPLVSVKLCQKLRLMVL